MPTGQYSFAQLEQLWINAGGPKSIAPVMAAIALAESSGIPSETNKTDNGGRQTSWGLWQISDGTHNMPVANILDPNVNAQQAVKKYRTQGLTAWGTYTSGRYRDYLKSGVSPDPNLPSGSTAVGNSGSAEQTGLIGNVGGAIGEGFATAFTSIFKPFIEIMIWGSETLIGVALMVAGFLIMVSNSKPVKNEEAKITSALLAGKTGSGPKPSDSLPDKSSKNVPLVTDTPEKPVKKPAPVKSVKSPEEFRKLRESGYKGKVRHDY